MGSQKPTSARVYYKPLLFFYDIWVHTISNKFAWRINKQDITDLYDANYNGSAHLEVAVGTGYFLLKEARAGDSIDLLDVHESTIEFAKNRLGELGIEANGVLQDVYKDFILDKRYKSIALNYLLHCLSGDKQKVLERLKFQLEDDGVLFGSTIINGNQDFSFFGNLLMFIYNKIGIFTNKEDTEENMQGIIKNVFPDAKIRIIGHVLFFSSR